MITVDEATALVREYSLPRPPLRIPFLDALGLVLAEGIVSQVNSPPYDKSLVDGFAVLSEDLRDERAEFVVNEQITAGQRPTRRVVPGTASSIMTGAPIPAGADTVVKIEHTERVSEADGSWRIRVCQSQVRSGQNIMKCGASLRNGETALKAGHLLRPVEIGILAELGVTSVLAHPRPTVAVLATGNELIAAGDSPMPGQIRNSNGPMILGLTRLAGGMASDLGIGRDEEEELTALVRRGLVHDILIISGGVSVGILDLVPEVLRRLGVRQVFHNVRLKPGKPLWFGVFSADERTRLVFGLPGNPVSVFVCFQLFVRPALSRLAGREERTPDLSSARLSCDYRQESDRQTYVPARFEAGSGESVVAPLDWKGSSDLRTLSNANCLVVLPEGKQHYPKESCVCVQRF